MRFWSSRTLLKIRPNPLLKQLPNNLLDRHDARLAENCSALDWERRDWSSASRIE
jgi:hypothetical protein